MQFQYYMPSRIFFGSGSLEQLGCVKLPGSKALVVISAGKSMRRSGYLDRLLGLLAANGVQSVVFDRIQPNPTKDSIMEGAALARTEGCDFVVGLGGGSSIDAAKAIAIMAVNPGDYWDYIHGGSGTGRPVPAGALPIVAVTTTAGTGTEADPWTVITKEDTNEKIGFGLDCTFPTLSIVDPDLMLTVPPKLTAYQGFDALFHATEGVIAKVASPLSDLYALKSIELISRWLPVAVHDGANAEARAHLAFANTLSGFVESTSSCTSEHSLEHALSAHHPDLPHGAGLVMLSMAYYGFFEPKLPPELYVKLARAMGVAVDDLPEGCRAHAFVEALGRLIEACDLDGLRMSSYGIARGDIPELARTARQTMANLFELDRYSLSYQETVEILEKAYR
jgi:alcohol dehydrogenase